VAWPGKGESIFLVFGTFLSFFGFSYLAIFLFSPELFEYDSWMDLSGRINILLTVAIAVFAAIEGYSTYMQVELQREKNLIEGAKNELDAVFCKSCGKKIGK
jgi:hypothetical protein